MDKKFRLPALLIILPPPAVALWYYLNTDTIGSALFGEKLNYCNVIGCAVSRNHFLMVALPLGALFIVGLGLLLIRSTNGGKNAKN